MPCASFSLLWFVCDLAILQACHYIILSITSQTTAVAVHTINTYICTYTYFGGDIVRVPSSLFSSKSLFPSLDLPIGPRASRFVGWCSVPPQRKGPGKTVAKGDLGCVVQQMRLRSLPLTRRICASRRARQTAVSSIVPAPSDSCWNRRISPLGCGVWTAAVLLY